MAVLIHLSCEKSRVREELRRRGLQVLLRSTGSHYGELCETRKGKGTDCRVQKGEESMIASDGHRQTFQEDINLVSLLKDCTKQQDLHQGTSVHADLVKKGSLRKNSYVGNHLINMYAKCGALAKAREVLDELPVRNVVSWTALIAGYAQHGQGEKALDCFKQMQQDGLSPDAVTFVCILRACGNIRALDKGRLVHTEILRKGLLAKNILVGTALLDMYAKCGALAKAQEVFDELPARNIVTWNALVTGYSQHGHGEEALYCFERMEYEGVPPDSITFSCTLKACGSIGAVEKGKVVHAKIVREVLLENSISVGNALLDMYAKCGLLAKAQEVFDKLPVRDVVSWNALIAGYAQHGLGVEALNLYKQMQSEDLMADEITFVCILKACSSIGASDTGRDIHAELITRGGLLQKSMLIGTALVDMYSKCGLLAKAREIFEELQIRDVVSWSALIEGYAQHGFGEEALHCLKQMQCEGLYPNAVTFLSILKACGSTGAADKGKHIHAEIVREGLMEQNSLLGNALLEMYAKCGALGKALEVFDKLSVRNVASWNALIAGYAQFGKGDSVFESVKRMIGEGIKPDPFTLTSVLSACSHSGLVDEGQMYFESISTGYGIVPTLEHHACMVDLYGRAGHFDKAAAVIKKMPSSDYLPAWIALLGACRKRGYMELGNLAFEHAVQCNKQDAAAYVCMSNIYAAAGMQDDADKIYEDEK